jgi:dolichol-phosphate mannosyltransferase
MILKVFSLSVNFDILVVDDSSPDGTGEVVKRLQSRFFKRLHLIERKEKSGLGTAYIAGFKWALQQDYEYIFEMDADFSHNPADLLRLYKVCSEEEADVAIGSRYISGVNVVNWPITRVLLSFFASKYVRLISGINIKDTTAGFKCYRREVLETIDLDKIHFKGYAFQIEMKFVAYKSGFRLKEIPIVFVNREAGTSKMSGGIFGEALFGVIQLKLHSLFHPYRTKK